MKRKWLTIGIILLFLVTCIIPGAAQDAGYSKPSKGNWLYVGGSGPGNYTTIQSAIDNANPGDTVFVYSGMYYEHVVVNKTIDLIGEDKDITVIDGGGTGVVVDISSDGVMISGFTVRNGDFGIHLCFFSNNTVTGNNACSNYLYGIILASSNSNTIMGNNASNNYVGIALSFSSSNTVTGNIASNNGVGIWLDVSSNNTVTGNNVSYNDYGIILTESSNNNVVGNTANSNVGGIFLGNSISNNITGNIVNSNTHYGISLGITNRNNITGNTVIHNYCGILLNNSTNNSIYHNNLINNTGNAADDFGSNNWDNGYPSGGNYWSDYNGIDNDCDGIGDTPYDISGGYNQDGYPFMEPNGWMNGPPDLTIRITGLLEINLLITNNGQTDANNISWVIHVQGRRILGQVNKTENGTINIPSGETKTIRTGILFFLGRITIMVKVPNEELTIQGFKMGPFLFIKK